METDLLPSCREASDLIDRLEFFFNYLNTQIYKSSIPRLNQIPEFVLNTFKMVQILSSPLQRENLTPCLRNLLRTILPKLIKNHIMLQSVSNLYLFQQIMNEDIMTYFCDQLLKLKKAPFLEHFTTLCLKYLLEVSERDTSNYQHNKWDLPFDASLKCINDLLKKFDDICKRHQLYKEEDNKYAFNFDKDKENEYLVELASSIHILMKKIFAANDALKNEDNPLGIQIASMFEMVISIFNQIYISFPDAQGQRQYKPLLTYSSHKDDIAKEANIAAKSKEVITKCSEALVKWQKNSMVKQEIAVDITSVTELLLEIEKRTNEIFEEMTKNRQVLVSGNYKDLATLQLQYMHIKYLAEFSELFSDETQMKLAKYEPGHIADQGHAEFKKGLAALALDIPVYQSLIEKDLMRELDSKFLEWLKSFNEYLRSLINIERKFSKQLIVSNDFLIHFVELIPFLRIEETLFRNLKRIQESYGNRYDRIFEYLYQHSQRLTTGLGINLMQINTLVRNLSCLIKFDEMEKELEELATSIENFVKQKSWIDVHRLKPDSEEALKIQRDATAVLNSYFAADYKQIKILEEFSQFDDFRRRISSPYFDKLKMALESIKQ